MLGYSFLLFWWPMFLIASADIRFLKQNSKECEPLTINCICGPPKVPKVIPIQIDQIWKENGSGCVAERDPSDFCQNLFCVLQKNESDTSFNISELAVKRENISSNSNPNFSRNTFPNGTPLDMRSVNASNNRQNLSRRPFENGTLAAKNENISTNYNQNYSRNPLTNGSFAMKTQNISSNHQPNGSINALPNVGAGGPEILDSLISPFYPIEFTIPRATEGLYRGDRLRRSAEPCAIPQLDNAEITCYKWPNWINCVVKCIYGYGLNMGNKVTRKTSVNCRLTEDKWKPRDFEDCKPYINCKAHLISPGDLNCVEPLKEPPYCDISCLEYDQYDAIETKRYVCNGTTFPNLPHCAMVNEGADLIPKPSD
ncbi:uncharacterized protein LOC118197730 isoform X5 [Stegodyphus dumicola]|uniref:uncharacterized protein LOC118197730 isoform X5 n=1 Tax=Stegodyphus dumicola TaxID=202533 RepID=UPI0015AA6F96|nr:uncharacterized protein LOC118197730 isoform X5 [Stegodyphus dumicola]